MICYLREQRLVLTYDTATETLRAETGEYRDSYEGGGAG